jgi:hypothetical protein
VEVNGCCSGNGPKWPVKPLEEEEKDKNIPILYKISDTTYL